MKDKLYSRRRINLTFIKTLKEASSIKKLLLIMFTTCFFIVVIFLKSAYPIFRASCETAASSKGNKIINQCVNETMKNYGYESLIKIEKDVDGRISFIETDSKKMNEVITEISNKIQKEFDKIPRITVFVNMGAVSGISVLEKYGPKIDVELESAGNLNSDLKTEFTSVGINQTLHKIYLDINSRVSILTPFGSFGKDITETVLLTEAIIVGNVPDTYYNLEDMEDLEKTYNFVE